MKQITRILAVNKLNALKKSLDDLIISIIADGVVLKDDVTESQWLDDIDLISETFDKLLK